LRHTPHSEGDTINHIAVPEGANDLSTPIYQGVSKRRVNIIQEQLPDPFAHMPLHSAVAYIQETEAILNDAQDLHDVNPFSYLSTTEQDTLNFRQMLQDHDRPKFETGMQDEISALLKSDLFDIVPTNTMPPGTKAVSAIWSFKRKRLPDWSISKWKARVCPHGGQQVHGINFWDTYAPVVQWSTVRLVLILSSLCELKSKQIDYVQAYTQAPIDCEIYMNVPNGFQAIDGTLKFVNGLRTKGLNNGHVLKLKRNMYGLRQGGHSWYIKLSNGLLKRGFTQSKVDKCLFLRHDCILVVYVDDYLLFSRETKIIDDIITSLRSEFVLTVEGDAGAFLGIDIKRNSEGHIELTQPGIIQKIIAECGLEDNSNQHDTPSTTTILQRDEYGPPRELKWHYRRMIGMLNYLSATSRPDIAYAVHQCARFSINPKRCHEIAVRRIVRYLKGTPTQGLTLRPSEDKNLNCYVDADFTGNWTKDTSHDPNSVKSRTGYVICFANCPVLWASKLQSEIALSTTEAEYIALSQAMRELIPMQSILKEISEMTKFIIGDTIAHCTVFEDNQGCIDLIHSPKINPRTRHISIKYHHFREHVRAGHLRIQWISTKDQLADIFTKPLPGPAFTYLRKLLLGWDTVSQFSLRTQRECCATEIAHNPRTDITRDSRAIGHLEKSNLIENRASFLKTTNKDLRGNQIIYPLNSFSRLP
jgi:hypothetical protein